MDKYICKSCGEDLREVGVYEKVYRNFAFNKSADRFYISSEDTDDNLLCGCCDAHVDIEI